MIEACRRLVSFLCRFCRSNSTSFFIPAASESSFCTLVRDIRVPSFFSKAISSAFSMARCSGYCSVSRVQQPCFFLTVRCVLPLCLCRVCRQRSLDFDAALATVLDALCLHCGIAICDPLSHLPQVCSPLSDSATVYPGPFLFLC